MRNVERVDKRKVIGTVIGSIFFICCILYFTYAYYNWQSENTLVNLSIEDASIKCTLGPDVNVNNIGPVLNYQDGVKATFSVENSTSESNTISISLDITSITETLLVESFKYKLVQDTSGGTDFDYDNPVTEGNFSTFVVGSNLIKSDVSVAGNSTYSFQFIVYIDGNIYNNNNMQQNSLNSSLTLGNCSGG